MSISRAKGLIDWLIFSEDSRVSECEQWNCENDLDKYLNMKESLHHNISKRYHWTVECEDKRRKVLMLKSHLRSSQIFSFLRGEGGEVIVNYWFLQPKESVKQAVL